MSTSLRLIFAGTPSFARVILSALVESGHNVLAVYTQPDSKQGRGLKTVLSPVKEYALRHHLPIKQPESLKSPEIQAELRAFHADVMIVAAYGLLLPKTVLDIPRFGCINVHPSLLPRWRGAAPIQRTIDSGDTISGVCIMQMDEGLDTGDILHQETYTLKSDETSETLHDILATLGASCLLKTLARLPISEQDRVKQDNLNATYAKKLSKEEALIDWNQPARHIDQHIRAYRPWPVAFTMWHGQPLKIWRAEVLSETHNKPAGTILRMDSHHLDIAAKENVLRLLEVQLPGGKRLSIQDFLNSKKQFLKLNELFSS